MSEKKLPQKLKELRKVNNYTQDYVAAVLGIVRQTYSHYETGRRTPDAEALYKLAGLYNISIDDLMHLRYCCVCWKRRFVEAALPTVPIDLFLKW